MMAEPIQRNDGFNHVKDTQDSRHYATLYKIAVHSSVDLSTWTRL